MRFSGILDEVASIGGSTGAEMFSSGRITFDDCIHLLWLG
ncbi:Hypothetical protein LOCK900_2506 [Lacticaseibacillus rhamnosus LOCK900]|nr:Hypothetical protein LOCK900_2506 [Lacticaseibacillus rhamnosus LOCK900]EHJ33041.1 hypothetical protein HMPREF0541_01073 [Lacticaseibacillus rhamnosus ATCC 21052]